MHLIRHKNAFIFLATLVLIVGCISHGAPIRNIEGQPVSTNRAASLDEIGNAIVRAGASLNMQMQKVRPGVINATYVPMGGAKQGLSATMEIKYDSKQYSINYKDSQGLKYDGTNIHKNYNNWVQSLDNRIRVQLSTL